MMLTPRNNFVVLRLIEMTTKTHGTIVVPVLKEQYTEAEVIAVGGGTVAAHGGRPDTHDLKPGQLVFVQHKKAISQKGDMAYAGVPYRQGGNTYYIFDETQIVGIVAETCEGIESYDNNPFDPSVGLLTPADKKIIH